MRYMIVLVVLLMAGCRGSEPCSPVPVRRVGEKAVPPVVVVPRYFVSLFCYESVPNRAGNSHNFATFVRWAGDDVQRVTISWYPASSDRGLLPRQPGRNFSLAETLERGRDRVLEELGPYECKSELWEKAVAADKRLASGGVDYKALGGSMECCNCIHAVLNVVRPGVKTGMCWGKSANKIVLREYRPWLISPGKVHPEVPR